MVVPGIRATEHLWVALPERDPGVRRDAGKELTQRDGEIASVIREGNIANEQFAFRHGGVPPCSGFVYLRVAFGRAATSDTSSTVSASLLVGPSVFGRCSD